MIYCRNLSKIGGACLISFLPLLMVVNAFCQTREDTLSIRTAIAHYYTGLEQKDIKLARSAFDSRLIFFNGNYSGDQTQWQSHMFLHDKKIDSWIQFMIDTAGPHHNTFTFKHIYIRGHSALLVTEETGHNKFRSWNNEVVVWNLGFREDTWRVISVFIKDVSNP